MMTFLEWRNHTQSRKSASHQLQYIPPQLSENATNPKVYDSFYYGKYNVIVDNESLYGIKGDTYYKADENVKSFSRVYEKTEG